ncbi:manC, partial [Symbiodinium sp. CCMP2456]
GKVAEEYFESGNFYWNAGIFIWKAKTVLDALKKHEPEMYAHLEAIANAWGTAEQAEVFDREFGAIQGKSIDYAVMEHHNDIVVVEAPFNWDDVGNWQSMARLHGQDDCGNTHLGDVLAIDSNGCIVRGEDGHLIVTLGTQELIIVHTPDATLVADKSREEDIRQVVKKLDEGGRIAAVDYGTVRIGIAITDPDRVLASPLENYNRRSPSKDAQFFRELAELERVVMFVVGLPVHMSGDESQKSHEAREFGKWLYETTNVPVTFYDERFTTSMAKDMLQEAGLTKKRRK